MAVLSQNNTQFEPDMNVAFVLVFKEKEIHALCLDFGGSLNPLRFWR